MRWLWLSKQRLAWVISSGEILLQLRENQMALR